MTAERWGQIKELFDAALTLGEAERDLMFARLPEEEISVRAEVEYLLLQHKLAGSFLDGSIPPAEQNALTLGQTISDRYEIIRFLGRGGMAEVYEAQDQDLSCLVALKVILPGLAADRTNSARLRREVRLARRITHPNVCRIFDFAHAEETDDEMLFITMELVDGETLANRLKRRGQMAVPEALVILRQVAEALEAAHTAGVVHRDLKPGNIMLTDLPGGHIRVVVMDFGLARSLAVRGASQKSSFG